MVAILRKNDLALKRKLRPTPQPVETATLISMGDLVHLPLPSQYPCSEISREVKSVLAAMPRGSQKLAAAAIGISESEMTRKLKATDARRFLHFEHLGRLAIFVSERYKTTPPGWPFITFAEWDKMRRFFIAGK